MIERKETDLSQALAAGRAAWPAVDLSEQRLAAFLVAANVPAEALRQHGADLVLAAACAAQIPDALACFEAKFISQVARYVRRMHLSPDLVDEIRQRLRIRMVGPEAKISSYGGAAPLDRWLRLACVRLALDLIDSEARHAGPGRGYELLQGIAGSDNPELNAIVARYAGLVEQELRSAIERLPGREKTILRLHFVEGLNVEGVGRIYGVHRATAARWIVAIRMRLLEDLRQRLEVETGATPSQFASLIACVEHELALSVTRLLAP